MSPIMLFLILLVVGILLVFLGRKMEGKSQIIFILLGVVLAVIGGYGIFTALCK